MKIKMQNLLLALAIFAGINHVTAQNTVFTYQGRVMDNGTNFTGTGQFQFALVTSTNYNHQATATANLGGVSPNYFISYCTLNGGGNGYAAAPAVTISGGGGSGATAFAIISGGIVTAVNVLTPGSGYTNVPTVTVAPPPANIAYVSFWSNDGTSVAGSQPSAAVNVGVTNGLFTVVLGDTTLANMAAINASLFAQPNLQLRIWFNDGIDGFAALSPVQNLTPTPYADFANNAGIAANATNATTATSATTANNFTGSLSGDVTGTQGATVVANVGGQSAANVASAVNAVNSATSANTASTIVERDANGNFSGGNITVANNLFLPSTGIIYLGGPFIHAYGSQNCFAGVGAGNFGLTGNADTGVGYEALENNTSGSFNTGIGWASLNSITSGTENTAVGYGAGKFLTTGNYNIDIANGGVAGEANTIRIGIQGFQTSTFIAGISEETAASGVAVYVNSSGQLGTLTSSAKFKEDIQSMGDASDVLLALKPVTFRYKPGIDPEGIPQFGLVAEDVSKVDPDLVARDDKNQIYTVRYQAVDAMLLNEFLKEHRKVEAQDNVIQGLQKSVADLQKIVQSLAEKK